MTSYRHWCTYGLSAGSVAILHSRTSSLSTLSMTRSVKDAIPSLTATGRGCLRMVRVTITIHTPNGPCTIAMVSLGYLSSSCFLSTPLLPPSLPPSLLPSFLSPFLLPSFPSPSPLPSPSSHPPPPRVVPSILIDQGVPPITVVHFGGHVC